MAKPKPKARHSSLVIESHVIRQMRQHARSHMKSEVCGVLIGSKRDDAIHVEAAIQGANASQAGTHVTFTQDTWEHVYKIKDKEYPDDRIVGWYHSHPGFGVFLSDHDTFIHRNFFSSPDQVAWVYDPHTDEEGCFAWVGERLERISTIEIRDRRGGELVDTNPRPEPSIVDLDDDEEQFVNIHAAESNRREDEENREPAWLRWTSVILSHVAVLLLGLFIAWYVFPRVIGIPVDPNTGRPLMKFMEPEQAEHGVPNRGPATEPNNRADQQSSPSANTNPATSKGDDGHRQQQ